MNSRTLARRLDRIEAKLNPTVKPGITVIVVGAGEEKILHVLAGGQFCTDRQNIPKANRLDDLERLETKVKPTVKPGVTVIVENAGEPKIFHLPDRTNTRQNISEGNRPDD